MRIQKQYAGFLVLLLGTTTAWPQQPPTVKATPLLKTTTTITGQKLEYPRKNPQVTATMVEIPPGVDVGWHEHPNIRYVYVIDGALSIELENGTRREFSAGTIFVEAVGDPASRHECRLDADQGPAHRPLGRGSVQYGQNRAPRSASRGTGRPPLDRPSETVA